MKTKINQQNVQINPELICAFCWFIFVFIIENARSKKHKSVEFAFRYSSEVVHMWYSYTYSRLKSILDLDYFTYVTIMYM